MSRRLVSVRKVTMILPIVGHADKRMVTADGFQIPVSSKVKLTSGDLIILIKANTFLPAHVPEWASLVPQTEWEGVSGFVVRKSAPLVVRGKPQAIFDGILAPVYEFPVIAEHLAKHIPTYQDDAVLLRALRETETFTNYLKVVEYNPQPGPAPAVFNGAMGMKPLPPPKTGSRRNKGRTHQIVGKRPYFCPKIDMINAEDITTLFASHNGNIQNKYAISTFMVGSPMSIFFISSTSQHIGAVKRALALPHGKMGVCSRTFELHADGTQHPHHWGVAKRLDLPRKLDALGKSVAIHGVLCGPTIRDDYERVPGGGYEFFAYAVQHVDTREASNGRLTAKGKLAPAGRDMWAYLDALGVQAVPAHTDASAMSAVARGQDALDKMASGPGWYAEKRAGLVFRNVKTGRAFKVMSKEYIERYGEASIRNETQDKDAFRFE